MRLTLLSTALVYALIALYPLTLYFGLQYFEPRTLAVYLLLIVLFRYCLATPGGAKIADRKLMSGVLVLGLCLALFAWLFNDLESLKLYPVLINFSLLLIFATSLFSPPTVIERLARLQEPELPESGVVYTRKVTIIWCLFFLLNGLIALLTSLYASTQLWTLYNGLIAYLLVAALFLSELAYRTFFLRKDEG